MKFHFCVSQKAFFLYFSSYLPQFERDKQHDIRSFFSPSVNKEKKRKRSGDSPSEGSPLPQLSKEEEPVQTLEIQSSDLKADQAEDFSPQVKRFRQVSPLSRCGGKKSSLSPLCTPRRLSAGLQAPRHNQKWNCSACTFSNSGLLLRCEMCESPRNVQKGDIIYTQIMSICVYISQFYFTWTINISKQHPVFEQTYVLNSFPTVHDTDMDNVSNLVAC